MQNPIKLKMAYRIHEHYPNIVMLVEFDPKRGLYYVVIAAKIEGGIAGRTLAEFTLPMQHKTEHGIVDQLGEWIEESCEAVKRSMN